MRIYNSLNKKENTPIKKQKQNKTKRPLGIIPKPQTLFLAKHQGAQVIVYYKTI